MASVDTSREPLERFLGLQRNDTDPRLWSLPIRRALCGPADRMFGGAGFAATLAVADRVGSWPVVAATCQFFGPAKLGETIALEVVEQRSSRRVSNLDIMARLDQAVLIRTAVTCAPPRPARDALASGAAPHLPAPDDCPPRPYREPDPKLIGGQLDVRLASPVASTGCALWARVPSVSVGSVALLGLLADHVPFAALLASDDAHGVTTLAMDLRVASNAPTGGWIALVVELDHVDGDLGHGRVQLWSEDRRLLAVSSQTFVLVPTA